VRALTDVWRALAEEETGPLTRWTCGSLLAALAWPYGWAQRVRVQAYTQGWATIKRLPCRVLSVGNLTLGGTGKTPLVEAIATMLRGHGQRVAVLSRGYGRRSQAPITVVSDGGKCLVSPEAAGDEPWLLAEHLPGVPVLVGNDRYAAGMLAVERFGVEVVVLDDGFQHLPLARDLDIVVLDSSDPFGGGYVLPAGRLRRIGNHHFEWPAHRHSHSSLRRLCGGIA